MSTGRACRYGLASLLLLLAACSSAPQRYHSLIDADDQGCRTGATMPDVAAQPLLIEVAPVHVARLLNTADMVYRQADGSLRVREGDHWGAPLPDELRSAISFGLQQRLCALDTYYLESAPGKIRYRIRSELLQADFSEDAGFRGTIRWLVQRNSDGAVVTATTSVQAPLPPGVEGHLIAYKRLARSVAADIAVALRSLQNQP